MITLIFGSLGGSVPLRLRMVLLLTVSLVLHCFQVMRPFRCLRWLVQRGEEERFL